MLQWLNVIKSTVQVECFGTQRNQKKKKKKILIHIVVTSTVSSVWEPGVDFYEAKYSSAFTQVVLFFWLAYLL